MSLPCPESRVPMSTTLPIPALTDGVQETKKAHDSLAFYCLLGPTRSLQKMVQSGPEQDHLRARTGPVSRNLSTLKLWSSQYHWQDRSAAYDAAIMAQAEAERLERERIKEAAREQMNADQADLSQKIASAAAARLLQILKMDIDLKLPVGNIPPSVLAQLRRIETDIERTARGVPLAYEDESTLVAYSKTIILTHEVDDDSPSTTPPTV